MSSTLDKIIEEVRQLPPHEQRHLVEQLNAIVHTPSSEDELEDEFERELVAEGGLGAINPLPDDDPEFYAYRPVSVTGKPVSETIMEDRR